MAEEEGFEPPELSFNGFQDRRLKPLGHSSETIDCKSGEGGIRTHGTRERSLDFESSAFDHSATSPTEREGFEPSVRV